MDRDAFRTVTAACAAIALATAGCGYRAGFTMPEGIDRIHVGVFENRTFYRGLDLELTELVKRELLVRTDLVIAREQAADVVLSCALNHVGKSILKEDRNDQPQEVQLTVGVTARARNRAGKTLFFEPGLRRSVRYVVALGETEDLARSRALQEVAEELVYRLAEQWSWHRKGAAPAGAAAAGKPAAGSE